MTDIRLFGYSHPFAGQAGKPVDFMISAEGTREVDVELVRLVHGDFNPKGPGFIEEIVESDIPAKLAVKRQYTQNGSFAFVEDPEELLTPKGAFTVHAFIRPSLLKGVRQTILGRWSVNQSKGYALGINTDNKLEFWIGDGKNVDQIKADAPLVENVWVLAVASFDPKNGEARLRQIDVQNSWNSHIGPVTPYDHNSNTLEKLRCVPALADTSFMMAGAGEENPERGRFVSMLYNGKIDRSGLVGRVLNENEIKAICEGIPPEHPIAYWDTTAGYGDRGIDTTIRDTGPHRLHAEGVNRPIRGMTGWNWRGREDCFRLDPSQYGGVSFHDDALTDCGWESTMTWVPPKKIKSGRLCAKNFTWRLC